MEVVIFDRKWRFPRFWSLHGFSTSSLERNNQLKNKVNNVNDVTCFQLLLSRGRFRFACTVVEKSDFKERVFPVKSDLGET